MDLRADIDWIQNELRQIEDPDFIATIKNMLKNRNTAEHTDRISIEQYNQEIDASLADIENGNVHSHEEVKDMIKQWKDK
jgi:predicted transcriptional regulator